MVCRQGKGCDDGGVMVVTAAVRHHDGGAEGDGESGGVQPSRVRWTGQLDWTPPDYSPAVLSGSAMDMAGHSVRRSPTRLCGGEKRTL